METKTKERPVAPEQMNLPPVPEEIEREDELEKEVQRRIASREKTLMARADESPEKIKRILENRVMILENSRKTVLKMSKPQDWTLYVARDGSTVAVPRDSLLVNAKKVYAIDIFSYRPHGPDGADPKIEKTDDVIERGDGDKKKIYPVYTATMWADAVCGLTGETLPEARFTARTGRFAGTEDNLNDLRQSARTGIDSYCVRKLTGLRKVPIEDLVEAGIDVSKCSKGSGFGTSTERGAGRVAEGDVAADAKKLGDEIMRRVNGDVQAAKDLLVELTTWTNEEGKKVKGFDSVGRFAKSYAVAKTFERLRGHGTFGDKALGIPAGEGAPETKGGGRQAGEEG